MPTFRVRLSLIKKYAAELNLFESEALHTNAFHLPTTIITTCIYLPILTLAVLVLIIYTIANGQTRTITFLKPSHVLYEELLEKKSTTLQCPCSQISVPHGSFITISAQFYPICTSFLVSDEWINLLFHQNSSHFIPFDFCSIAHAHFRTLCTLCSFAMKSVHDAIADFSSDTLLTPEVIQRESLIEQIRGQVDFLKISTQNSARHLVRLLR
jgi:hypothetical protein